MEKRRFSRALFDAKCVLVRGAGRFDALVEDLSLKGARVALEADPGMAEGDSLVIQISLARSAVRITAEAVVARREDEQRGDENAVRIGLRFSSIDLDSMIHLRRLLELNSQSVDRIDAEMGKFGPD